MELMERSKHAHLTFWRYIKIKKKNAVFVEITLSGVEKMFRDAKRKNSALTKLHIYHLYRALNGHSLLCKTKHKYSQ